MAETYEGKPCAKCGNVVRYRSSRTPVCRCRFDAALKDKHNAYNKKYRRTEHGRATGQKWLKSEAGRASAQKYVASAKGYLNERRKAIKQNRKRYDDAHRAY